MGGEVKQIVETSNDDGRSGIITVTTVDNEGHERTASHEYNSSYSKAEATERATQSALDKGY
jgi:hypothetical protein